MAKGESGARRKAIFEYWLKPHRPRRRPPARLYASPTVSKRVGIETTGGACKIRVRPSQNSVAKWSQHGLFASLGFPPKPLQNSVSKLGGRFRPTTASLKCGIRLRGKHFHLQGMLGCVGHPASPQKPSATTELDEESERDSTLNLPARSEFPRGTWCYTLPGG